jgi:hypothetical protein
VKKDDDRARSHPQSLENLNAILLARAGALYAKASSLSDFANANACTVKAQQRRGNIGKDGRITPRGIEALKDFPL